MKLSVRKHDIEVSEPQRLVSGSINLVSCQFSFDESWDGYGKTAVFASFGGVWAVPLVADEAIIPWEALEAGRRLRIGVYGVKGSTRLPTVYTEPLFVETGAEEGKESGEPTQSKWMQLMAAIESGLLKGEAGYTPVKGKDYFTEADIAEIVQAVGGMASAPQGAVMYTAQSLNASQRLQARVNIGAASKEDINTAISNAFGAVSAAFEEMDEVIG
ncbi:MAG: hypothetical protein IKT47_04530 [Oscillospiraceae bacterium]|nr:hypothetical protein [Oscillospiraceae bacterium]